MRLFPLAVLVVAVVASGVVQAAAAALAPPDAETWPHPLTLANAEILVYQPQVNSWDDNHLVFRCAIAVKPTGAKNETFGSITASARTDVDKVARVVTLHDLTITSHRFPTLPDNGAAYVGGIREQIAIHASEIALDRLQASLAAAGIKPSSFAVQNQPPRIYVSYSPAILVPVDGDPSLQPLAGDDRFQRVINTRALIVQNTMLQSFYLHVYDGWLVANSMAGPWTVPQDPIMGLDQIAQKLEASGTVDLLTGKPPDGKAPSLKNGVPTIYTPTVPAELIVFKGQPNLIPVNDTSLLWASNTTNDVLVDSDNNAYYALLAGRWFKAASLDGPWAFVASNALPAGFRRIPAHSPAAVVLPSVAGTPQAKEAVIANSIPQTATVPINHGPTFTPVLDGAPVFEPVADTSLQYVVNSSVPIIKVAKDSYYAVDAGVWFTAPGINGPWRIAMSVPDVIYTIPISSPIYYATYVHVYGTTPEVVYVGYTPGYLGTVVAPSGVVVYGTGYSYTPWVGSVWYAAPYTYGVAAVPVYNPAVGMTYGFAMGLATAAWMDGGNYYHPYYYGGYGCCATASANVYGRWGSTSYSGTRTWTTQPGAIGTTAKGNYYNQRTGTQGQYQVSRSYNANSGNATRSYDRNFSNPSGASGKVSRTANYNAYTGQRSYESGLSAQGADGSAVQRSADATAGPDGVSRQAQTSVYNAQTGESHSWSSGSGQLANDRYADKDGNVYQNSGDGWQQHGANGWDKGSGASSWGDAESQARSEGDDRAQSFSHSGGGFGSGGFDGGDRSGGGFGGADRFGGGGFGGGGFGGRFGGGGGFRR